MANNQALSTAAQKNDFIKNEGNTTTVEESLAEDVDMTENETASTRPVPVSSRDVSLVSNKKSKGLFDKYPPITTGLRNGKVPALTSNEISVKATTHHPTDPLKGNSQRDGTTNIMPGRLYQGIGKPNKLPEAKNQQAQRAVDDTSKTIQPGAGYLTGIKPNVYAKTTGDASKNTGPTGETQDEQRCWNMV